LFTVIFYQQTTEQTLTEDEIFIKIDNECIKTERLNDFEELTSRVAAIAGDQDFQIIYKRKFIPNPKE